MNNPLGRDAPEWARELAASYVGGSASVFLVHGNVHDLVPIPDTDEPEFVSLEHYLATQLFGQRDIILSYDRGSGIRFLAPGDSERRASMQEDFHKTLKAIDLISGTSYANSRPKDPKLVFELLDRYILHKLVDTPKEGNRKSLAIVIRYIEMIAPVVDGAMLSGELGATLIKVLNWANDPGIRAADVTLCLVTEALGDVNRRIVENPFISKVEVDLPDGSTRERYARTLVKNAKAARDVAREANGLTLVGLAQAVGSSGARGNHVDLGKLREAKKDLIEKQCFGLVEFMAPNYDLDAVVAPVAVKERLEQDVRLFKDGRFDALPMGYLFCGVVGTGKTFTAMCLAGSFGIPTILFKNLRSKWVGSSESNLQKVLSVIKALGPVVVVIDEADAALGSRSAGGDSGTSSRMFAMISSLMGDTRYRGKILWVLLTCRPDLLPVGLKRQGRCEVHIPLFPPETEAARREMFIAMAKKNDVSIDVNDLPPLPPDLSGADIESLLVQCVRRAALAGADAPNAEHIRDTLEHFRSPDYGLEKELQQLVAIRESTDPKFIPERLRERYGAADKSLALERRIQEISALLR